MSSIGPIARGFRIELSGSTLVLHGIQVRADVQGTEVAHPKYRAGDGSWHTAITLPEDIRGPMCNAIIAAGIEAGVLKRR